MSFWRQMTRGLRSLLNRSTADREIADEVEHYFDEAAAALQSRGLSPEEARRAVRSQFGPARSVQDRVRAYGWENVVDTVGADLRYGARQLYRRPAFTLAAVLTLALSIGATTAIFSVVYSVLIKPLPYPNADALVSIRHAAPGVNTDDVTSDPTMYLAYRDENRTFANIGLWDARSATLTDRGTATRLRALRVTDGTLQALGVHPMRGRWFTQQEQYGPAAAGQQSVILSYAFWQRRFGGDEAVLGSELTMEAPSNSTSYPWVGRWQVVGIMPRTFRFLDWSPQPDVIIPLRLDPAREKISNFSFSMLARLKAGVTPADAEMDIERMLPIWLHAWPTVPGSSLTRTALAHWRITPGVRPLKDDLVGSVASALWVILGAIGAVLLIACANIANLMLVRADGRRQEFAVRAALGGVPARIARQLLVESVCLGAAGTVLGVLLAYVGVPVLVANGPSNLPRLQEIAVYPTVLAFTVAISLASTLVFGSITAVKHARYIDAPMTGAARGSSPSREQSATRSALVVVQVALALVLVVSAALMIRTFQALHHVDPGFSDPATIQTAQTWIPFTLGLNAERATRLQHEILNGIAALPGVESVGFAIDVPMGEFRGNGGVVVEGETIAAGDGPRGVRLNYVSPGYFEAMRTRIVTGRDMTWNDIETGGRVVLISEDFAREIAGAPAAALGKRIRAAVEGAGWHEVIGVVQTVHQDGLYRDPPTMVYWPVLIANRFGQSAVTFAIRSERAGSATLVEEVRRTIWSVNGNIPVGQERTMQDFYSGTLARTSFTLVMLALAGGMALMLGVIGVYGVIAYTVARRTREIGIRSALGAQHRQLGRMFLLHGLALSGAGAAAGLVAALALRRVMSSLLFGIGPMDPAAYAAAIGLTLAAATLASYIPARRAATIDPMLTMKAE
ncbi:MAG TPA: ABC transporter permease [Vicinamibacterales bacterium]|jgi:predicted permease